MTDAGGYRGRIAPTPSGLLHLGHARTFWTACHRAEAAGGVLVYRNEDLDRPRCTEAFRDAAIDDLRWLGVRWHEGPDVGGPFGPYSQSERGAVYLEAWKRLADSGRIYPSPHTRKDVENALLAPQEDDREVIFPTVLRPPEGVRFDTSLPGATNWRFRVPDGRAIEFDDLGAGRVRFVAGEDFGDFIVWRRDGLPSYELAVVADDHAMQITEVVRGEDLLLSTARQLLLYEACGWRSPRFCHVPLVRNEQGRRLAKRSDGLSLRRLRALGFRPQQVFQLIGERNMVSPPPARE